MPRFSLGALLFSALLILIDLRPAVPALSAYHFNHLSKRTYYDDDLLIALERRLVARCEERAAALLERHFTKLNAISDESNKANKNIGVPVGTILPFAGSQIPDGWLPCDGRLLTKAEYQELFNVIGEQFNKNASLQNTSSEFQLPDFRGRALIGVGKGEGLTERNLGAHLGVERHKLSVREMPAHSHSVTDPGHTHTAIGWTEPRVWGYAQVMSDNLLTDIGTQPSSPSFTGVSLGATGGSKPHENIQPSAVVNFIIKAGAVTSKVTTTTTPPLPAVTPWPKAAHLLGFWPLNSYYKLHDVSQNHFHGESSTSTYRPTIGPFGDADTALEVETTNAYVLEVLDENLSVNSSFTVSLFFKRRERNDSQQERGIFEFVDQFRTRKAFQFLYVNRTTIEVRANGHTVGSYTMVQQKDVWTYVAFVFNGSTAMFTVYGKHGVVSPSSFQVNIFASNSFNNNGIRLGYASRWKNGLQTGDAVSCLMIYSTALTAVEVRQTYEACRVIHNSAPCGSSKLPLPPISTANSVTTIPKPGQFPFIASLRLGSSHVCSASIIDEYWLLTSAACFVDSRNPKLYSIIVGQYDLNVYDSSTRRYACSKIVLPKTGPANLAEKGIALVELNEPIDFTSLFVNDACLFGAKMEDVSFDVTQFVFGWGRNGRPAIVSPFVGRSVPGLMLSDLHCLQSWGPESYTPGEDFCFMSASSDKNIPCAGDEGTPLLVQAHSKPTIGLGDRLVQIGVYYKRDLNCTAKPGLFKNVAQYSTWMAEQIACSVPGFAYPETCPQS